MNIVDPILFQCRFQPTAPALFVPGADGRIVNYQQLGQFIENVRRRTGALGLGRNKIIALAIQDQLLHVAMMLGLTKLGLVTISTHQLQLPKGLQIDAAFTDSKILAEENRVATLVDKSWLSEPGPLSAVRNEPFVTGSDYCRLFLTSGTTGDPKVVALTHAQLSKRLLQREMVLGVRFSRCSRVFVGLGVSTVPGHTALLHALSRGGALLLQGGTSTETLQALAAHQIQAVLASPQNLSNMVELYEKAPGTFKKLDVVVPFGSSVSPKLSKALRKGVCNELISMYGSTELASIATAHMETIEVVQGAVGYLTPGVAVDILDGEGSLLPVGQVGRVRIRSACAAEGYVEDGLDNVVPFPDEGMFPGDLGTLTADGLLVISGRENSVINLGGNKTSPERIEAALTTFANVRDAGVFTFQNGVGIPQLVGVVVWSEHIDEDASRKDLRQHLEKLISPALIPSLFVELREIPRNHMGKIDRDALKERALDLIRKTKEMGRLTAAVRKVRRLS